MMNTIAMRSDYAAMPQQQQPVVAAVAVTVPDGSHDDNSRSSNNSIPVEARGLTWNDTYYVENNISGVIAVFDVDGDKLRRTMWFCFAVFIMILVAISFGMYFIILTPSTNVYGDDDNFGFYCTIFWIVYSAGVTYTLLNQFTKTSKGINGLHVAVTKEGIRYDMHRYPFGNMFRLTMIIPYNEIKAIQVQRTCGGCCGKTGNVYIQSSEDDTWTTIQGLTDGADEFVALVKAMIARNALIEYDVEHQPHPTKE